MQAVLVQRAGALLAQAADVTAERLAMVRAQGDRTMVCVKEAKAVVAIAERVGRVRGSPWLRDCLLLGGEWLVRSAFRS